MEDRLLATAAIEKCWKYTDYTALLFLMVLPVKSPLFKLALALHTGLLTILYVFYAIIIYFKSFNVSDHDEKRGSIIKLLNYIPTVMSMAASFMLNAISRGFQLITQSKSRINLNLYSQVITFALISSRKLFSLTSWGYITEEDDNAMHLRTLMMFCIFNLVQYRFIVQRNSSFKRSNQKLGAIEGLKLVFTDDSGMSPSFQCSLLKFRRTLFFGLAVLATSTCISLLYNGFILNDVSDYQASNFIMKLLLFVDVQFSLTLWMELHGLEFTFTTDNNSSYGHYKV